MHQELFKNRKYTSALKRNLQFELFFCCRLWDLEQCHAIQCINTKPEVSAHRNRSWERLRLCRSVSEQIITHVILGRQPQFTNQTQHQGALSSKTHTHVEEILSRFDFIFFSLFFFSFSKINIGPLSIPHYNWASHDFPLCIWHQG